MKNLTIKNKYQMGDVLKQNPNNLVNSNKLYDSYNSEVCAKAIADNRDNRKLTEHNVRKAAQFTHGFVSLRIQTTRTKGTWTQRLGSEMYRKPMGEEIYAITQGVSWMLRQVVIVTKDKSHMHVVIMVEHMDWPKVMHQCTLRGRAVRLENICTAEKPAQHEIVI